MTKRTEYDRAYYERNAERIKERQREYYAANRERVKLRVKNRHRDAKVEAVAMLGGKCSRCPESHPAALQFHHVRPEIKKFEITANILTTPGLYPRDVILEEIAKCVLLCANCHAKEHCTWEVV